MMNNTDQIETILKGRQVLNVGGVKGVDSFEGDRITADSQLGYLMIRGKNLKITQLNLDEGALSIEGWISAVEYQDDHKEINKESVKKIFNKLFK
ncbi:MAG: sporulation protein YabP [Peptococcaceae bacterium]|jgi:sporulation protein YabP|nr:sporulation protein YabP [Peptococcaceae bacterium]